MTAPLAITIVAALVLAVWISRHVTLGATRRTQTVLQPDQSSALPADPPKVTIIVPAKDEAANIAACLETLLAQDYPDFEVIVVDDRSTDRTAAEVERLAARDPRLRLVQVRELPPGWFGKSHALAVAARQAAGAWLLFVDADCRQQPASLRTALAYALAEKADMLSLWPLLEMRSFAENLVQPLCSAVLALYFRPQWVNNPRRKIAFANGQFILIRRSVYEAVGGHEAVRRRLVEDIALARVVKGRGYRLLNALGFDLFQTRMYDSLGSVWRGWARIFSGAFRSTWLVVPVLLLVLLVSASPFVLTAAAGLLAAQADWQDAQLNVLLALGLAQLAVMFSVLWRYNRLIRARSAFLPLYPLSVLLVIGILLHALMLGLGLARVSWRGTTYRHGVNLTAERGRGPSL